jgi:hypothetical protein
MKRVIVICLICSLSACAGMHSKDSISERNKVSQKYQNDSEFDQAYMATVERQASRNGVVVKWVSPPKAPKEVKPKKDGQ